ncbi:hypothetical protein BC938DRAFT_473583 [Jimgerdemannia flammicorona]|uniref:Uncharacterized protein n=1 Tax=Jimgerdemannia flammicorona TaxID=994334 RepID=A0A433QT73_9FUNG|nr:hypothetical protein BC938DRAFT_473583 [Jimgerdemannia flammicorona]
MPSPSGRCGVRKTPSSAIRNWITEDWDRGGVGDLMLCCVGIIEVRAVSHKSGFIQLVFLSLI